MLKNIRHIAFLLVIIIGVLSNNFAYSSVPGASKISVEKSTVEAVGINGNLVVKHPVNSILAADTGLSILDGALYFKEGNSSQAYLALGGAALGASGVLFKQLKILLRKGDKIIKYDILANAEKAGLSGPEIDELFEDLRLSTRRPDSWEVNTFGRNEWAAFFAENGDEGIKAWEKAILRLNYRKDVNFLQKLSDLMEPNIVSKFPNGQKDIDDIIAALVHPHTGTTHTFMKNVAEHLDDIKHLATNFSGVSGYDKVLTALKNPNFYAQDGASHLLTKLKTLTSGDVAKLEGKIIDADNLDNIDDLCTNCLFDIQLTSGKNLELKSFSETTIAAMPNSTKFKNQFKAYLAGSNNGFEYIFNGKKTQDLTLIKDNFKTIFKEGNYRLYDDILSANPNSTIFSSLNINNNAQFIQAVNNLNSDLYKFITIL